MSCACLTFCFSLSMTNRGSVRQMFFHCCFCNPISDGLSTVEIKSRRKPVEPSSKNKKQKQTWEAPCNWVILRKHSPVRRTCQWRGEWNWVAPWRGGTASRASSRCDTPQCSDTWICGLYPWCRSAETENRESDQDELKDNRSKPPVSHASSSFDLSSFFDVW